MAGSTEVGYSRATNLETEPPGLATADLLGFPVVTSSRVEILNTCLDYVDQRKQLHIVTLNPEMILAAKRSSEARSAVAAGDLYVADGVGLEWAAKVRGISGVRRYPGIELCSDLMVRLAPREGRVYLLGSKPGVAEQAAGRLTAQFPRLNICGFRDGYFTPEQEAGVVANICQAAPDLLLVGMGSPRQEGFISKHRDELGVPLMVGAGGALEVYAGHKRRAPALLRKAGLEWAWRSMIDISRLKRLGQLPAFVWLVLAGRGRAA